jgi:xylose isomerase
MFKAKAKQFDNDPAVKQLLADIYKGNPEHISLLEEVKKGYTKDLATRLKEIDFNPQALGERGYQYEKLDQLAVEHILGVR